jgi:hypothetical protein
MVAIQLPDNHLKKVISDSMNNRNFVRLCYGSDEGVVYLPD